MRGRPVLTRSLSANYFVAPIPRKRAKNMDAADQCLIEEEMLVAAPRRSETRTLMEGVGVHVSRYGLVVTLLLIGVLKFTACEAQGIQPLVASSPLMFLLYHIFTLHTFSDLIRAIEI